MHQNELSVEEWLLFSSWITAFVCVIYWAWQKRDALAIFSPPIFLIIFNAYYCLFGPLHSVLTKNTLYRGLDLRQDLALTWSVSLIAFLVMVLAYRFTKPKPSSPPTDQVPPPEKVSQIGQMMNFIALILFFAYAGSSIVNLLNPFDSVGLEKTSLLYESAFSNYLHYAINLLIPGITLMWIAWLQKRQGFISILVWGVICLAIFTSLGFRYRFALLFASLYVVYHLVRQKRPNPVVIIVLFFFLVLGSGYFVMGRSYDRGVDLSNVGQKSVGDVVSSGLSESNIFWTSAGVLKVVPSRQPFVYLTPVINTLLFPMPKVWFPEKDTYQYILDVTSEIYGSDLMATGSFFMGWAEWYLMAGWFGVVVMAALQGWIYRWLWEWFRTRRTDPIAAAYYAGAASYQYMILSRGYMPQQMMLFAFSVLPLWLLYRFSSGKAKLTNRTYKSILSK